MARKQHKLRCFAMREKASGQWLAFCVDLNLAVQAPTLTEAQRKLHEQVVDYIEDLRGVHAEHAKDLFPRPAPLRIRAWYAFARVVGGLALILRGRESTRARPFVEVAPLPC